MRSMELCYHGFMSGLRRGAGHEREAIWVVSSGSERTNSAHTSLGEMVNNNESRIQSNETGQPATTDGLRPYALGERASILDTAYLWVPGKAKDIGGMCDCEFGGVRVGSLANSNASLQENSGSFSLATAHKSLSIIGSRPPHLPRGKQQDSFPIRPYYYE